MINILQKPIRNQNIRVQEKDASKKYEQQNKRKFSQEENG